MGGQHIRSAGAYPGAPASMLNAGKNHNLRFRAAREKDLPHQPDGLFTSLFVEVQCLSARPGANVSRGESIEGLFVAIPLPWDFEITNRHGIRQL